jgi:excisionase family DNA binding protein
MVVMERTGSELRLIIREVVAEVADRDRYMPKSEASVYLGLSVSNVEKRLGELPHFRVGSKVMFRKSELDRWMEKNREKPADLDLDRLADEAVRAVLGTRKNHQL